jgi:Flp pilus assembly protein TadD
MKRTPHMPPALSNKALATILSVASGLAWAGPTPNVSGPYLGDAYGPVEFRTEGEKVVGTATATGGACRFPAGTPVIEGELEGHVLVARVLVCQQGGTQCAAQEHYPAFVIVNPHDRVLSALIRLREGCSSPALQRDPQQKHTQLLLRSTAPQDERPEGEAEAASAADAGGEEARAPSAPAAPASAEGSGTATAQARAREPEAPPLEQAQRQLAAGNPAAAQPLFEQVLATDARNAAALMGLAACHVQLGNAAKAVKTLEPAAKASNRPDLHLWLAYAHQRDRKQGRARDALRKAMDLGWAPGNRPAEAVPEAALQQDIQVLMQQRARKRSSGREATGSGSPSP